MQLSEGRAFNSKCKGPGVVYLMILRNSTRTEGLQQSEGECEKGEGE